MSVLNVVDKNENRNLSRHSPCVLIGETVCADWNSV